MVKSSNVIQDVMFILCPLTEWASDLGKRKFQTNNEKLQLPTQMSAQVIMMYCLGEFRNASCTMPEKVRECVTYILR